MSPPACQGSQEQSPGLAGDLQLELSQQRHSTGSGSPGSPTAGARLDFGSSRLEQAQQQTLQQGDRAELVGSQAGSQRNGFGSPISASGSQQALKERDGNLPPGAAAGAAGAGTAKLAAHQQHQQHQAPEAAQARSQAAPAAASAAGVFAGAVAIVDPALDGEVAAAVLEALAAGGAQLAAGTHLGCGANLVVAAPSRAAKWAGHMCDIVTPAWVARSAAAC